MKIRFDSTIMLTEADAQSFADRHADASSGKRDVSETRPAES